MSWVSRFCRCVLVVIAAQMLAGTAAAQVIFSGNFEYEGIVGAADTVVQTTDPDGTTLVVSVPAGAVFEDTPFTIEADTAPADTLARFRLGPAGTRFYKPVTLTVFPGKHLTLADLSLSLLDSDNRVYLPFAVQETSLSVELHTLGLNLTPAKAAGDVFLDVQLVDCQAELQNLDKLLDDAMMLGFTVPLVVPMVDNFQAAQQCFAPSDPNALAAITTSIQQEACADGETALQDIEPEDLENVDDVGTLREMFSIVLGAEGAMQLTGAECPPAGQALSAIESAYQVFIENFRERVALPTFLESPGAWKTHWAHEMQQSALDLREDAAMLGLSPIATEITTTLLPDILDEFRFIAYKRCQEDNTQQYLADVRTAGFLGGHPIAAAPEVPDWAFFTSEDVEADIQYCRSQVDVTVYEALGEVLPDQGADLGGLGPGLEEDQADVEVPPDGTIVLDGSITALLCAYGPGSAQFDNDKLIIRADTEVLGELDHYAGELLGNPFEVDISQALKTLGLPDTGGTFALTISRESPACGGVYGPQIFDLFSLDVDAAEPCPSETKGILPGCDGYARLDRHSGGVEYDADAELRDTVNDETVIKIIEVDEEFDHLESDLSAFVFDLDSAPNTSRTISSAGGDLRSIKLEGIHTSVPSESNGKLVQYRVDTQVTLSATSDGYQSGISDYADVQFQVGGSISFSALGGPVYGSLSATVSENGTTTGEFSRVETHVRIGAFEGNGGGGSITIDGGDALDLTFLPGEEGEHGISYNIGVYARANFGEGQGQVGQATADVTVSLELQLDP